MNSLISSHYVEQNQKLHEINDKYGTNSAHRANNILEVINALAASSILDYGCGKALLFQELAKRPRDFKQQCQIMNYDPAVPEFAEPPQPADLVVCTDVLEHVEPEYLSNVLADLRRLTLKMLYLAIAIRPSSKTLPDGRNSHLIVEPVSWWMPKLRGTFTPCRTSWNKNELVTLLLPR